MAKKKASTSAPAKTAVKKVAVKKSVGKKGTVKKKTPAEETTVLQGPVPVNYALRLVGQFGGAYYYLMLQCPNMDQVLGVVKSGSGGLGKDCAAIVPAGQNLVHYEWYKGYRPTSET
jgi:hypothetical protein